MKTHSHYIIAGIILAAVAALPLSAQQYEARALVPSPRMSALGGLQGTIADGFGTMLNNPAGFLASKPELSVSELTFGLKGPIFSIADVFLNESGNLDDILDIVEGSFAGIETAGPLAFGYTGNGLGFGIYNLTSLSVNAMSLVPLLSASETILLTGGYTYRMPFSTSRHILDAGINLKGFFRGQVDAPMTEVDPSVLMGEPFHFISGIGMDLGLRYEFTERWIFSLVGRDAYTPTLRRTYESVNDFFDGTGTVVTKKGHVPFRLDAGAMFRHRFQKPGFFMDELKVMASYYDALDFWLYPTLSSNPVLHAGIGVELTMLEILDLRVGFNQGLFAAGLGLDLYYFGLNMAMFGTEYSPEPGMKPVYNLQVSLDFIR